MRATQRPKQESSWSLSRWDRRRRKSRIGHRVLNGSTIGLLPSYRWRGGIIVVERVECDAYRAYGRLPANSRQSPRAGPRGLMCLRLGTSYRRIKCAHQGGAVSGGRVRQGRTRSQGGGRSSKEPERGSRWGPRSPLGAGALTLARGPRRGKYCSTEPRRGEWLGPHNPLAVGAMLQTQGSQKSKHYPSGPRRGEWLGLQNPRAVGAVLQTQGSQKGKDYPSGPRRGEWLGPQNPRAVGAML